jgi:hypothetical protein
MMPIEQTSSGMLVFLKCGCAAFRQRTHPTGAAALVLITQPCDEHLGHDEHVDGIRLRSIRRGELVSPFVRMPVTPESFSTR